MYSQTCALRGEPSPDAKDLAPDKTVETGQEREHLSAAQVQAPAPPGGPSYGTGVGGRSGTRSSPLSFLLSE